MGVGRRVNGLLQGNNLGQVSIVIVEIEAVPDNELVRDLEADVVDGGLLGDRAFLSEEDTRFHTGRAHLVEEGDNFAESAAAVEDVVEEEDVAAADVTELAAEDEFDRTIARTSDKLVGMARAALEEYRSGQTEELDPEKI